MPLNVPSSSPGGLQYATPVLSDTVAVSESAGILILEPAGTIAAATVLLPSGSLYDGRKVTLACSQIITTLTLGGGTIVNGIATFAAGGFADYTYRAANGKWYKTG